MEEFYTPHTVLWKELRKLERDPQKGKIDHPEEGSKDCADAVAGVVYVLSQKEASFGRVREGRTRPWRGEGVDAGSMASRRIHR